MIRLTESPAAQMGMHVFDHSILALDEAPFEFHVMLHLLASTLIAN